MISIIDKSGKTLLLGSRVRTGTMASPGTYYYGTVVSFKKKWFHYTVTLMYDTGILDDFECWETIPGTQYQAEEVERA